MPPTTSTTLPTSTIPISTLPVVSMMAIKPQAMSITHLCVSRQTRSTISAQFRISSSTSLTPSSQTIGTTVCLPTVVLSALALTRLFGRFLAILTPRFSMSTSPTTTSGPSGPSLTGTLLRLNLSSTLDSLTKATSHQLPTLASSPRPRARTCCLSICSCSERPTLTTRLPTSPS